jgi:hypothetical protein
MALRLLLYVGRVYEKIIDNKMIYTSKQMTVPYPEFFVLYNGTAPYPDETTLKLSDLFENLKALGLPDKEIPALELVVKVININEGKNEALAKRCRLLSEYSAFVAKAREFEKEGLKRSEAIKKAVIYCRDHDILKEFLEKNASEVLNMLLTEWNWDDAKDVWQEEKAEDIAKNALVEGLSVDAVHRITGLDLETIKEIKVKT